MDFVRIHKALAVIVVLQRIRPARAAEIKQNPRRHALHIVCCSQHGELSPVDLRLRLLREFILGRAVMAVFCPCSVFGDDDWLVRMRAGEECGQEAVIRSIPAAVFIEADDIEMRRETVADRIVRRNKACGRNLSRAVKSPCKIRKPAHKGEPGVRIRILIPHRPDDDARAVIIPLNQLRQLICRIFVCCGILKIDCPVNRNLLPQHHAHLIGQFRHLLVVRIMGQPHVIAAEFLRRLNC